MSQMSSCVSQWLGRKRATFTGGGQGFVGVQARAMSEVNGAVITEGVWGMTFVCQGLEQDNAPKGVVHTQEVCTVLDPNESRQV